MAKRDRVTKLAGLDDPLVMGMAEAMAYSRIDKMIREYESDLQYYGSTNREKSERHVIAGMKRARELFGRTRDL